MLQNYYEDEVILWRIKEWNQNTVSILSEKVIFEQSSNFMKKEHYI